MDETEQRWYYVTLNLGEGWLLEGVKLADSPSHARTQLQDALARGVGMPRARIRVAGPIPADRVALPPSHLPGDVPVDPADGGTTDAGKAEQDG